MAQVTVTLEGTQTQDVHGWTTWRGMRQGSLSLKLIHFLSPSYKPGCYSTWIDLPTSFRMGFRNTAGVQVGVVEWSHTQFNVTKSISLPASGNYAANTRFTPFNGKGTVPPSNPCYETYFHPFFKVQATFTPNT